MKKVVLNVTVTGGTAPATISIYLDGPQPDHHVKFTATSSFSKELALDPGDYRITVGGLNPDTGATEAAISGEFTQEPVPGKTQTATTKLYSLLFFFSI